MGCCPSKKQLEYIDEHPQLDGEKAVVSHSKHEVLECNQQREHAIQDKSVTEDDILGEIEATKVEEEPSCVAEDEDTIEENQQNDVIKEYQVCVSFPRSENENQNLPSAPSMESIRKLRKNSSKSVSREEIPIDSMFHRLQLIKEEEEKYKKEEELRLEREMMDRDVREYKMNL